ncbi:phosphoribosylaminoimidazolesuccinocarboxamide synthase [Tersicoccus phoenicis]|uniref:Phosphoribosylaminoimidazole-succinocarboxamide synthase n=1 Tax=Tersicoccus phoenicis TaxID=554083 RepID=A0A1R1LJ70_9MICC|nr:phosphoribosylaminoimidazolesuccinocarboxamide synthase [Tersicoccus phoenicis]OMH27572.1 phosphoribosylaminoimidazolesuccinocarboxamide synthase [Tersicoccus phoenicis]
MSPGLLEAPKIPGWTHVYSGKVRELYVPTVPEHGDGDGDPQLIPERHVLVVATDRISAYDHVLATPIPDKGRILTQLSLWWFEQLDDVENHVVSADVPDEVAGRAMICRNLSMFPIECIARGYLTGTGLTEYRRSGTVCGLSLPDGLTEGSALEPPLYTPSAKAAVGEHDENITYEQTVEAVGADVADRLRELTLRVYGRAERIARERGLVLADTKVEFGLDVHDGTITLADEVLTPDSSRFWDAAAWQPGRPQASFDKQFVRDWLTSPASGWDRAADTPPPALPDDVVAATRDRYLEAYERLTGRTF